LSPQLYDEIGAGYGAYRRPDPRIAAAIDLALDDAGTVLNVGAGAGSYEPADRKVVAVEPSLLMIRQRGAGSAPVAQASATDLPFRDGAFVATLAILTLHHWPDRPRGLAELARVARRRAVMLTWDPAAPSFWLIDDYFPALAAIDRPIFPTIEELGYRIVIATTPQRT
jgi:SAM-dependent methyltransferase